MLLYISGFNSTKKAFISNNQSIDVYYVIENDYAKDISQLGEIIRQHPKVDIAGHSTGRILRFDAENNFSGSDPAIVFDQSGDGSCKSPGQES
jgi:hypothetical protein